MTVRHGFQNSEFNSEMKIQKKKKYRYVLEHWCFLNVRLDLRNGLKNITGPHEPLHRPNVLCELRVLVPIYPSLRGKIF